MALNMFLKVGTIKGESADPDHQDWLDALAWSWGESNSGNTHVSPPASGTASLQDLSITTYLDKAAPLLMAACAAGTIFTAATLVAVAPGTTPIEVLRYKMDTVLVSSISNGGSSGEDRFTQSISLNYAKITWTYVPVVGGVAGTPISRSWNNVTG
jgi:type VI secretion system secreted protein Hcp